MSSTGVWDGLAMLVKRRRKTLLSDTRNMNWKWLQCRSFWPLGGMRNGGRKGLAFKVEACFGRIFRANRVGRPVELSLIPMNDERCST